MRLLHGTKEQGFTIVEVLIALTIFSIAVTGVITVAAQSGVSISKARNKLAADYLASEGLEAVRALRDSSVLANPGTESTTGWSSFRSAVSGCTVTSPCDVDVVTEGSFPALASLSTSCPTSLPLPGCSLYITMDGFYSNRNDTGRDPLSPYTREITTRVLPSGDEIEITATVRWLEGTSLQASTVTESLFNWYPDAP